MKTILFPLFFLLGVSGLYSQNHYLNVNLKNGTCITYDIADITKIDFGNIVTSQEAQKLIQIITTFKVMQNYPNPFNPSTTIQYEIPGAGKVEIQIFNITGQLVKTIENRHNTGGSYLIMWDGNNEAEVKVASGLYLYSVTYEHTTQSKKMILVK
jgi:hypothetical protein